MKIEKTITRNILTGMLLVILLSTRPPPLLLLYTQQGQACATIQKSYQGDRWRFGTQYALPHKMELGLSCWESNASSLVEEGYEFRFSYVLCGSSRSSLGVVHREG